MKLVSLNRVRRVMELREREAARARLVHTARQASSEIDGYALVMYRRNGTKMTVHSDYFCRDPMDTFMLANLAQQKIAQLIADSCSPTKPDDRDGAA